MTNNPTGYRRRLQFFTGGENKTQRVKEGTETGPLKNEGNKAFHAVLIHSVLVGKLLEHEFFFVAQFDPNAHKY